MDIDTIIKFVTLIAGILAIIFGPKPLSELIKNMWQYLKGVQEKRRTKNQPPIPPLPSVEIGQDNSVAPQNSEIQKNDAAVNDFSGLVKNGDYEEAVKRAPLEREKISPNEYSDNYLTQLALDDFDVWHARALIYTGETAAGKDGLALLDEIIDRITTKYDDAALGKFYAGRKRMILGRAYNDKGYAHWMEKGHHEIALNEFSNAIKQYAEADSGSDNLVLQELIATAYDNLGRIYAQLGNQFRAELLIELGKKIRSNLGKDRYALSLNSSAISHVAFGNHYDAQELSRGALEYFKQTGSARGEGLALITMGQAHRHIGELWMFDKDRGIDKYKDSLDVAEAVLTEAINTFTKVSEPIRSCQIYNELGCVYRERARLTRDYLKTFDQAKEYFEKGIDIAETYKYQTMQADGYEDLAQLFKIVNDINKSNIYIEKAKGIIRSISPNYFFQKNKEAKSVPAEICVEEFWQQLGKMYALQGHLAWDDERRTGKLANNRNLGGAMKKPMENYALAAGYFGRFLQAGDASDIKMADKFGIQAGDAGDIKKIDKSGMRSMLMNHRAFGVQIYNRFHELKLDKVKIKEIEDVLLKVKKDYHLKDAWVDSFFEEIFDLLKQTRP